MYQGSAFRQGLHHFLLMLCGFCHNCVILHLRRRQMQLIGGLNVRHLFEQGH